VQTRAPRGHRAHPQTISNGAVFQSPQRTEVVAQMKERVDKQQTRQLAKRARNLQRADALSLPKSRVISFESRPSALWRRSC
jgi:hypothetical protein